MPLKLTIHKGITEVFDPNNGSWVGIFSEECAADGSAKVRVKQENPLKFEEGASLRIYGPSGTAVILKIVTSTVHDTVKEFSGTSAVGCVAEKTPVTLVRDPGGLLNNLLIMLGKGVVRQAEEKDR